MKSTHVYREINHASELLEIQISSCESFAHRGIDDLCMMTIVQKKDAYDDDEDFKTHSVTFSPSGVKVLVAALGEVISNIRKENRR